MKSTLKHLQLAILMLLSFNCFSQDNIIKKNGDEIKAKILEIGISEIKYKKFENQAGPSYTILKSDVFMIKYENGTKDVFSEEPKTEDKKSPTPTEKPKTEKPATEKSTPTPSDAAPSKMESYKERVREAQSKDPSFTFSLGNGFLLDPPGLSNPIIGAELRMSRKNVFLRGLSVGVRACYKNIASEADTYDRNGNVITFDYRCVYGYGLTVKYFAPLPLKKLQPYIITMVGAGQFDIEYGTIIEDNNTSNDYHFSSFDIKPILGFGVGCNFMLAKRFGFYTELGYFTITAINAGILIKI